MIGDIVSKVLIQYKADTSDARKELEKLKGAERERAQAAIDANKKVEGSLESQIKMFAKVGGAALAAIKIGQEFWSAHEELQEKRRQDLAAGFIDIENLRKSTSRLVTDTDLLSNAAKRNSGEFKLSTKQFADAEKAVRSLHRGGTDLEKATEAVNKAIVTLKTEGLAELGHGLDLSGIKIDTASGRLEAHSKIMEHLAKLGKDAGEGQAGFGRETEQAAVLFANSWSKVKDKMGEVTEQLGPLILKLAQLLDYAGQIADGATGDRAAKNKLTSEVTRIQGLVTINKGMEAGFDASIGDGYGTQVGARESLPAGMSADDLKKWQADLEARKNKTPAKFDAAAAALRQAAALLSRASVGDAGGSVQGAYGIGVANIGGSRAEMGGLLGGDIGKGLRGAEQARRSEMLTSNWDASMAKMSAMDAASKQSPLEGMFGPLSEFDAYATGWQTLTGAMTTAYDAIVSGEMSAGAAVKAFLKDSLKSMGARMVIRGLEEVAEGFAALANPNPVWGAKSAASHFIAAAKFGIGAAAAGVMSAAISGGSSGGGGGAGRAAPVGSGGGSGAPQYQGQKEVYIVGDSFGETTPRQQVKNVKRRLDQAGYGSGVKFK